MKNTFAISIVVLLVGAGLAPAQVNATGSIYLIGATPTARGPITYPARLYKVGADRSVLMVRALASKEDGVEFVLEDDQTAVIGTPHISPSEVHIVHFDSPLTADDVQLKGEGVVLDAQLAHPQSFGTMLVLNRGLGITPFRSDVLGVSISGTISPRVVEPLDPAVFADIWYEGQPGGTEPSLSLSLASLTSDGISFFNAGEKVRTRLRGPAPNGLPAELARESHPLNAMLKCANNRFAVFSAGGRIFLENLSAGSVRPMDKLNLRSHLRIFGSWLAVTVAEPNPGNKRVNPGSENQRHFENRSRQFASDEPPVRDFYAENPAEEWFPGTLELINLENDQTIRIQTNQADSEILRVSGDTVIYRINHQILTATIRGTSLESTRVVADDDNMSEVHWAFWSAN